MTELSAAAPRWRQCLDALLGRHFWILAYLCLLLGFCVPGDWRAAAPLVKIFLGGILFFTCLLISLGSLGSELAQGPRRWRLGLAIVLKLVLVPLLVLALLWPVAGPWWAGLLLVALMPAGLSSAAFANLYGGNPAMGLLLVLGSSLLCPLSVPLLLGLCTSQQISVAGVLAQMATLAILLCVPFFSAQAVRWAAPAWVLRHRAWWRPLTVLCLSLLIFVSVAANRHAWAEESWRALLTATLVCCAASGLFLVFTMLMRRWWGREDSITLACAMVYMNNGLSVAFATTFFSGNAHMILPSIVMQLPMVGVIALISPLMSASARRQERSLAATSSAGPPPLP